MQDRNREFEFSKKDFEFLSELVFDESGIVLEAKKYEMVYGRLARRIRSLKLNGFSDYVNLLKGPRHQQEISFLIDSITTNLTKFFREDYQLKALVKDVFETKRAEVKKNGGEKKLKIWSAGCSSGQEPYSLAMVAHSWFRAHPDWEVVILATDIDRNMLKKGSDGIYSANEAATIPESLRRKYAHKMSDGRYQMDDRLKEIIRFKRLNFMEEWPMKGKFDVIFCRNVLIYFDSETKDWLVKRFTDQLKDGGMLYLGHSEGMIGTIPGLNVYGRSSFCKGSR